MRANRIKDVKVITPEVFWDNVCKLLIARFSVEGQVTSSQAKLQDDEPQYPCSDCGELLSKNQGGTVFTVCESCWDKHYKKPQIKAGDLTECQFITTDSCRVTSVTGSRVHSSCLTQICDRHVSRVKLKTAEELKAERQLDHNYNPKDSSPFTSDTGIKQQGEACHWCGDNPTPGYILLDPQCCEDCEQEIEDKDCDCRIEDYMSRWIPCPICGGTGRKPVYYEELGEQLNDSEERLEQMIRDGEVGREPNEILLTEADVNGLLGFKTGNYPTVRRLLQQQLCNVINYFEAHRVGPERWAKLRKEAGVE